MYSQNNYEFKKNKNHPLRLKEKSSFSFAEFSGSSYCQIGRKKLTILFSVTWRLFRSILSFSLHFSFNLQKDKLMCWSPVHLYLDRAKYTLWIWMTEWSVSEKCQFINLFCSYITGHWSFYTKVNKYNTTQIIFGNLTVVHKYFFFLSQLKLQLTSPLTNTTLMGLSLPGHYIFW